MGPAGRTALVTLLLLVPLNSAASLGVVTDSRVPIFVDALIGVRAAPDDDVRVYDVSERSPEELKEAVSRDRPNAVIAIGPTAVPVAKAAPTGAAVVLLLNPKAETDAKAFSGRPLKAIALNVPPESTLKMLRRIAPQARQLWTIYSERSSGSVVGRLDSAAAAAGYSLTKTKVTDAAAAARALGEPPPRVDASVLLGDAVVRNAAFDEGLLRLAFSRQFPVIGASRTDVQAGALFAFQLDAEALGLQAAKLARALTREPGTTSGPTLLPPAGYQLVLNVATARTLGLTIPQDLRRQASELFGE